MSEYKDLSDFIVQQLTKARVRLPYKQSNRKNIMAFCFVGHDRKTPSLSIRRLDGAFYCFGCGVRGSNWNSIAHHIPVETLEDENLPDPRVAFKYKLKREWEQAMLNIDLPWDLEPWTGPWRKIREDTLTTVGAFKWFDDMSRCYRILLPVVMRNAVEGWVARRLDKAARGRKLRTPYRNAEHMSSKYVVFPYDTVVEMDREKVVVVEGPYDALRLINYDIPALSILGTQNYHPSNRGFIANACQGEVIVAMDEDKAGETARLDIAMSLREMFHVEHFRCPAGKDPGNMDRKSLKRLWEMTR